MCCGVVLGSQNIVPLLLTLFPGDYMAKKGTMSDQPPLLFC